MEKAELIKSETGIGVYASIMAASVLLAPITAFIIGKNLSFTFYTIEDCLIFFIAVIIIVISTFYIETIYGRLNSKRSYYFVNKYGKIKLRIWKIFPWILSLIAALLFTVCLIFAYVSAVLSELS